VTGRTDTDNTVVKLVADQGVSVGQPHCASWQRRRNARRVGVYDVLPDNFVVGIDLDGPGVSGIGQERVTVFEATGEGNNTNRPTGSERPDNLVGACYLDRSIIVLIGDEDVPVLEQFG